MNLVLEVALQSETAFGRGDGVAGAVDAEVQYDAHGFPYLHGRTLKGMLNEECVNILYSLRETTIDAKWEAIANRLFGVPESGASGAGALTVGNAELPAALRAAVAGAQAGGTEKHAPDQVLQSLTTVRWRTAIDAETGSPRKETLRSERVILRNLVFTAPLALEKTNDDALALLAACVAALRRVGRGRNRGQGAVKARLLAEDGSDVSISWLDTFVAEVKACSPVS